MTNLPTDAIEECIESYEDADSDTGGTSFRIEASAQLDALKAEIEAQGVYIKKLEEECYPQKWETFGNGGFA